MVKEHEEFYDRVCSPKFETIVADNKTSFKEVMKNIDDTKAKIDKIHELLKGKNGEAGMCDTVRENAKFRKRIFYAVGVLFTVAVGQIVIWIRQKLLGE